MNYNELVKQWGKVDMDYLKKLINIHNDIVLGNKSEKEFSDLINIEY